MCPGQTTWISTALADDLSYKDGHSEAVFCCEKHQSRLGGSLYSWSYQTPAVQEDLSSCTAKEPGADIVHGSCSHTHYTSFLQIKISDKFFKYTLICYSVNIYHHAQQKTHQQLLILVMRVITQFYIKFLESVLLLSIICLKSWYQTRCFVQKHPLSLCYLMITFFLVSDKYILFDGFTYNTRGWFTSCGVFFQAPKGQGKIRPMSEMSAGVICKTME